MKVRSGLLIVLAVASLFTFAGPAFPQGSTAVAQLNGTVLDESGGAVKGAAILLRQTDTNRSYNAVANDSGYYAIPNLPPGHYELTTSFKGFATTVRKGVELTVGQSATIDVTLKVASMGEQVIVTTEAPVIEPTKTEISQVIGTQEINSLPISGRLFTDFALLTPGVATGRTSLQSTITEFEVTRVSFGGMRDLSNLVTVDGADNINTATGSQRSTPPQEAVAEFRVVNSSFGAEYGRALGGIVNIVTKSGGNEFHGSVYDYLQNNATDARSLLQPAPDANTLRQNQFGATLGGPIKKDKIFFFTNYEGQRRGESPTYPTTLTQPVMAFSSTPPFAPTVATTNIALIDQAKATLGLAPEGCNVPLPQCPNLSPNAFLNSVLKTKDNDYGIIKIDDQLNAANHLSIRYNVEDARDLNQLVGATLDGGGIGAPSSGHDVFLRDQSLVGTVATTINPDLVNSVLVQYARRHYNFPGVTGQPNLDIPNTLLFGHNFGVLDAIYESRLQLADSLSWVKGNHVAKFGVDFNYVNNFVIWPGFTPMRIVLPGINCLVDFANFVNSESLTPLPPVPSAPANGPCPVANPPFFPAQPGPNPVNDPLSGVPIAFWGAPVGFAPNPPNGQLPTPPPIPTTWQNAYLPSKTADFSETLDHNYYGIYAQDQWRIKHNLTMNYGLRYDVESGLTKQINAHYNGVQPRIGFAYSPDSKTVIRTGFGIFDDRYNLSFLFITQPQRPVIIPGETLPGIRDGANTAGWVLNQFTPGPLGLPSMAAATLVTTGQVPDQFITGPCPPSCTAGAGMVEHNSKIPYSEQANLEIDRELTRGLTASIGYMWVAAHHLVRAENLNVCPPFGAPAGTTVPEVTPGIPNCTPPPPPPAGWPTGKAYFGAPGTTGGPAYNNSGLLYYTDNSGNSVYNGVTLQVIERFNKVFNLDANYTFSHTLDDGTFTTFVSTPQDLYDRSLERANSNQDVRQRFITNFTATAPNDSFLRHFALSSIITLQTGRPFTEFVGFDSNGDTNPVTDRVGDLGRNTYYGDHLYSWDLRISRYFQIRERMRLDLIADAFNLLNRPNVDEVTSVYGAAVICGGTAVPKNFKDRATIETQQQAIAFDEGTGGPTCPNLAPIPSPPVPNALFGTPRTMLNPRQFQFAAKLSF
ncbi:MAG TPA: TonB-dependent receptor [Terriglobales bacterium]|nr:TonB-dependent receptor [Terriglobales bacterium]